MSTLTSNIHTQAESLASVLEHHRGAGAPAIAEAAALLRSGKRVVITAMGASFFAAIPLQYCLCALGINAVAIEAGELLHYLGNTWDDAVVLMVSRSGESVEIARMLDRMEGRVPVIGVTNEPESRLAKSAQVSLYLSSFSDQIVAIQTYTATLLVLHLLACAIQDSFVAGADQVQSLLPAFASLVTESLAAVAAWDEFLSPLSPLYLLARGPSLASAYEGALLFHEVAKSPAVAMPVASFRHGPVEVVDAGFRALVFAPHDGTRELNLALARDLERFGAQLKIIDFSPDGAASANTSEMPPLPGTLAPLFEIIPVQVAALRLAILKGIEPGSFRFAPQVSVDEFSFPGERTPDDRSQRSPHRGVTESDHQQ